MTKIAASTVKGTGFTLTRAANQPFYAIAKTAPTVAAQSPNIGYAYKNADDGSYAVTLGLERTVLPDFNAVKTFLKEKLAA